MALPTSNPDPTPASTAPSAARLASAHLQPGVRRREVLAWAGYDFANSGYTTVVLTAVFNAYFVGVVAANAPWATLAWTATLALSNLLVMAITPLAGAYADLHAKKKSLLLASTAGCVATTAALAAVGPGDLALAVVCVALSNLFFTLGTGLVAAFLPELARPQALGRVSGWGWGFGYLGGLLTLGLCLAFVTAARADGQPAEFFVPVTMVIVAAVFALAAAPTFLLVKERAVPQVGAQVGATLAASAERLLRTVRQARRYRDFMRLLVVGVLYQAGVSVVIALAAIYAQQAMGFDFQQTMVLVLVVNVAAAIGAFGFGHLQDRVGHRAALALTLLAWLAMTLIAGLATSVAAFWVAAHFAGLAMGSSQSAGRAMVGVFAPPDRRAEFYGLWTLATQLAAIVGPLSYGLVTYATGNDHRAGILATGLFFVAALAALRGIDVARGSAARGEADGAAPAA